MDERTLIALAWVLVGVVLLAAVGFIGLRWIALRIARRIVEAAPDTKFLLVGDELALRIEDLAELRLRDRHRPGRRAVIGDDVEHDLEVLFAHAARERGEIQGGTRQVLVEHEEVVGPVAVVAGLAAIGQAALPPDRIAAAERLVRIVGDRRDPDRPETEVADVAGIVQHALEVAAEVADVVGLAVRSGDRNIERALRTALLALVVARIAVDEAVGDDEVDRVTGQRLDRAVERAGSVRLGCMRAGA